MSYLVVDEFGSGRGYESGAAGLVASSTTSVIYRSMSSDGATELHWSCERLGLLKMGLLKIGNGCGLYEGSTEELRRRLSQCRIDAPLAMDLRDYILQCYTENESKLSELGPQYERLPCSTEVLESSFGCFKAMQRHHNRGTFTTLLAALPTIFSNFTASGIRTQFRAVTNKHLQQWYADQNLNNSTHARRAAAYAAAA